MPDYSKKRCVVCSQTGGIAASETDPGLYVCKHCGTPYRSRKSATEEPPDAPTRPKALPNRLIWFSYEDEGQQRSGLYDFPVLPEGTRPKLVINNNRLHFYRYLVQKGLLIGDTEPSQ